MVITETQYGGKDNMEENGFHIKEIYSYLFTN